MSLDTLSVAYTLLYLEEFLPIELLICWKGNYDNEKCSLAQKPQTVTKYDKMRKWNQNTRAGVCDVRLYTLKDNVSRKNLTLRLYVTAIQWVSLLRIFLCGVSRINRVERRGERLRVSSRRASTSTSSTCFAWLRCLRQCCCFLRCSGRCWENRENVLSSTDHGPNWRLLLSRRGSQLALSSWIWRAAQALTGKLKRRWK